MRIATLGASAQDYLDSAKAGETRAKTSTDLVDARQNNGFPGFETVWQKIWGIGQGILNLAPLPGSVTRPEEKKPVVDKSNAGLSIGVAVLAFGALYVVISKKRRTVKSRYRRMIRNRK